MIDKLSHQLNQFIYVKVSGSLTEETTEDSDIYTEYMQYTDIYSDSEDTEDKDEDEIIPESPQPKRANYSRQVF